MEMNFHVQKIQKAITKLLSMQNKIHSINLQLEEVAITLSSFESESIHTIQNKIKENTQEIKRIENTIKQYRLLLSRVRDLYAKSETKIVAVMEKAPRINTSGTGYHSLEHYKSMQKDNGMKFL